MEFTTTTEISRKWSKAFSQTKETIILNNNKMLGLYLPAELWQAVLDSWIINQIREELWELNDKETVKTIRDYKQWKKTDSIDFGDYLKENNIKI